MIGKRLQVVLLAIGAFFLLSGFKCRPDFNNASTGILYEDNDADTYVIGDSRIFHMRNSMETASACNWIAINGSGYDVLKGTMVPVLSREALKGKTIIVESGLNDIIFDGGIQKAYLKYYDFYNTVAQTWIKRGAKVKILKILPIKPWSEHNITINSHIQFYNAVLEANLPANIEVIDLSNEHLGYVDELHFDSETSVRLYESLMSAF